MKKIFTFVLALVAMTAVMAQSRVYINTWNKQDLTKYDNQQKNISMSRYMFNGWNTLCIPFSMTEDQINEAFGSDCRVETLIAAEEDANGVTVYFSDVKANGIEANKPYLIYYTGESKYKSVKLDDVTINATGAEALVCNTNKGSEVALIGTYSHIDGLDSYGILAKDNSDTKFVPVTTGLNGFYPTRCFLTVNGGNDVNVSFMHGAPTRISNVVAEGQQSSDVYNLKGMKVSEYYKGLVIKNGKKFVK